MKSVICIKTAWIDDENNLNVHWQKKEIATDTELLKEGIESFALRDLELLEPMAVLDRIEKACQIAARGKPAPGWVGLVRVLPNMTFQMDEAELGLERLGKALDQVVNEVGSDEEERS